MTPDRVAFYPVCLPWICAVLLLVSSARAQSTKSSGPSATQPATQPAKRMSNEQVRRALDRQLPQTKFKADLSEAIDFMRDVTGLPIDVQWDELKKIGITEKTPVTVNLGKAWMRDILTAILTSASGKPGVVGYAIVKGKLVVGPTNPPKAQPK